MKVKNVKFSNIDIIDSKNDAVYLFRWGGDMFSNIVFENIMIDGTGKEFPYNDSKEANAERGYGFLFKFKPKGTVSYCNITVKNRGGNVKNDFGKEGIGTLEWKESTDCVPSNK
jgi:hypothetical protein